MLTATMSLNWANTTAQRVPRPGFAPDAQGCYYVCVSAVPLTCTQLQWPRKGRQSGQAGWQVGLADGQAKLARDRAAATGLLGNARFWGGRGPLRGWRTWL